MLNVEIPVRNLISKLDFPSCLGLGGKPCFWPEWYMGDSVTFLRASHWVYDLSLSCFLGVFSVIIW